MGAVVGMGLGAINVLVVAIAYRLSGEEGAFFVFMFGILPGLGTGAFLGCIGDLMKKVHPVARWLVLAVPAVGAVAVLGDFFGMYDLIVYASIPTLAISTILERQTRAKPVPPAIPVARAS